MRRFDLPAKAVVQSQFLVAGTPPSQASQLPHEIPVATKIPDLPPTPVGAGLPAKAVVQSQFLVAGTPPSQASQLPHEIHVATKIPDLPPTPVGAGLPAKAVVQSQLLVAGTPPSPASQLPHEIPVATKIPDLPPAPVGAAVRRFDLPAKAVVQSQFLVAGTPPSQASQLPHEIPVATKIPDLPPTPLWERACPRKRWFSHNLWWQVHRHRRQASSHMRSLSQPKSRTCHHPPVGAAVRRFDLPAKAVVQSQFLVAGTPPSQASQLPHEIHVATKIPDLPPTPCGSGGATIRLARESGGSVTISGGRYTAIAGKSGSYIQQVIAVIEGPHA